MKKNKIILNSFICMLLMYGCSADQNNKESELALLKTTNPPPLEMSNENSEDLIHQVEKTMKQFNEIYDTAIIRNENKILIAYKVKHMHRFKMKKIEKNLKKRLKEDFPNEKIIVSSDYKIFLEVIRLKEDIERSKISKKDAEKRFKKITKLKEEMT